MDGNNIIYDQLFKFRISMKIIIKLILLVLMFTNPQEDLCAQNIDSLRDNQGKTLADKLWLSNPFEWSANPLTKSGNSWNITTIRAPVNWYINKNDANPLTTNELAAITQGAIDRFRFMELRSREIWDWGIYFWKRYPKDLRRFEWFKQAVDCIPYFWKNVDTGSLEFVKKDFKSAIDLTSYRQWEENFYLMQNEYLESISSNEEKARFKHRIEYYLLRWHRLYPDIRGGKKLDISKIEEHANEVGSCYHDKSEIMGKNSLLEMLSLPLLLADNYGLEKNDLLSFYTSLSKSSESYIREFALQKINVVKLLGGKFVLNHPDIDGRRFDINNLKSKLIYLDIWNTSCKSCIHSMPSIKKIYDQYKEQGFEVVSVCVNPQKDKKRVLEIHDSVGAKWPLLLIGGKGDSNIMGGLAKEIWDKYGFTSVPQTFVLDEYGKVIAYQATLSELREIIKDRLIKN